MATVEKWMFVNMFVAENFAVILAVAKLPTMIAIWVLDWSAFTVATAKSKSANSSSTFPHPSVHTSTPQTVALQKIRTTEVETEAEEITNSTQ